MTKYLINKNIYGYENVIVDELNKLEAKDDLFIVVISKSCDDKLSTYYKGLNKLLKNHNKIILISLDDENKSFKSLASLLLTFNNYDIYEVVSEDVISAEYLQKLEDREPTYSEVQTFIGGDVTAYTDMSMILFGIESLTEEGNIDGLKTFIEEHMSTIGNLTVSINNMKKTCDMFNSKELVDEVEVLKNTEDKLNKALIEKDKKIDEIKVDRDKHKTEVESLKKENTKLKDKTKDLESQTESSGSVIKSFKTIQTQLLTGNKTKTILYFKELTYVKYTNTLVTNIFEFIKRKKLKVKFLIYDTNSELGNIYNPLRVVNGNDYITDKTNLINKVEKFVVAEPAQNILTDILTSDNAFDVVIIYDRMHTINDLVAGNLVSKFYVLNSRQDYDSLKNQLKINDVSAIITNTENSLNLSREWKVQGNRDFIDIPAIQDYKRNEVVSNSFGFSRYVKQAGTYTKKSIIETILDKSNISTLY